jgi:hypothetical protein
MDLLTPATADEAFNNDFDVKDHILIIHTETDAETLREAGFAERTPEVIN